MIVHRVAVCPHARSTEIPRCPYPGCHAADGSGRCTVERDVQGFAFVRTAFEAREVDGRWLWVDVEQRRFDDE